MSLVRRVKSVFKRKPVCENLTYLSSQASIPLAAPISSTTAVRNTLGGLLGLPPSYEGFFLRSDAQLFKFLEAARICPTRLFRLSVSTPQFYKNKQQIYYKTTNYILSTTMLGSVIGCQDVATWLLWCFGIKSPPKTSDILVCKCAWCPSDNVKNFSPIPNPRYELYHK